MGVDSPTGTIIAGLRVEELVARVRRGTVVPRRGRAAAVALKVLSPELAHDERFRQRFLRESRLAASLDHPHIVPTSPPARTTASSTSRWRYVEGSDLRELLRREGRLDPARPLLLAPGCARARRGARRRARPPGREARQHPRRRRAGRRARVRLRLRPRAPRVVVSSLTSDRGFVGTIDYIPPEQIEGGPIDRRADVYSLGCVLFECLAGARPFDRESELSVVFAHLNEPPPLVTDRPELPEAFDDVIANALAKSPDDRYADEQRARRGRARTPSRGGWAPQRRRREARIF